MLSNKCLYAVLAMLELAKRIGTGPVTIAEIAREQKVPARFLEAILRQLKQGGFTYSVRGKDGGYLLSGDPGQIRVGDIIRHFEGPILSVDKTALSSVSENSRQILTKFMEDAATALETAYDGTTFKELAARELELRNQFVANYTI